MIGESAGSGWYTAGTRSGWRWRRRRGCCPTLSPCLGWESCDHTGPVHEGDTLYSELHVDEAAPLPDGRGGVLKLRSLVYAVGDPDRQVLDWRFTALQFSASRRKRPRKPACWGTFTSARAEKAQ